MLGTSFLDSATSDLPLWTTTTTTQQQQQSPTISSQQQQYPILNPFGDTMLFDQQQSSPTLTSTSSSTTHHHHHHPPPALTQYGQGAVLAKQASPIASPRGVRRRNQLITPEMAYASVKKPFSYADGYHYLINYVRQKYV